MNEFKADNELVIDGVTYVRVHYPSAIFCGDASGIWNQFSEKRRNEIRRRMMAMLVEAGHFIRKDEYEKKHSVYAKGELFYEG